MHSVRPRASDLCIAGVPDTLRWAVKTGYYNKIELLCSFDRLCYESLSGAQMMLGIAGFDAKDINRMRKNMQTEIGVYPYTSFLNAMFLGLFANPVISLPTDKYI